MNRTGKSILLADDDADDCVLFEDALREVSRGSLLTTANDGVELMDILQEIVPPPPDVIFLDLNMPRKNGFECLQEIKRTKKFQNIPIVIFSTTSEPSAINRVYEEGASFYICKPGSFQKLKEAIEQILAINFSDIVTPTSKDRFFLSF